MFLGAIENMIQFLLDPRRLPTQLSQRHKAHPTHLREFVRRLRTCDALIVESVFVMVSATRNAKLVADHLVYETVFLGYPT